MLDGENGSVGCRVYGPFGTSTLPKLSENYVIESATRSWLRMRNLVAVRGVPGASMIGPADYFGNLETPHRYLYTIHFQSWNPIPEFRRFPIHPETMVMMDEKLWHDLDAKDSVRIRGQWKSHELDKDKNLFGGASLFPRSGLFLLEDEKDILLPNFDPRWAKLERFRARLVRNDVPFCITARAIPVADEYRLVTYVYGSGYAERQIKHGGGLFLESHAFSQFITPMNRQCSGYVLLAVPVTGHIHDYDLLAIHIPYGWTLIIDPGCIHGDTTLVGHFLMGMTSNHRTMASADTVFLRDRRQRNVRTRVVAMATKEQEEDLTKGDGPKCQDPNGEMTCRPPHVLYYDGCEGAGWDEFEAETRRFNFIVNPTSVGYWYSFG